jgi:hypothetical protein
MVRVGVVGLELLDVADRRPAEGVDRLVGVTDDDELAGGDGTVLGGGWSSDRRRARGRADILRVVGVLVLVDQHVPEPPPIVLGDVRESLEHVDRRHDEVVEVQGVGLTQAALIHR